MAISVTQMCLSTIGLLTCVLSACSPSSATSGSGSLAVLLEPEPTILEGLKPGTRVDQISDGWTVTFDKYILGVGQVHVGLSSDPGVEAEADEAFFIDLTRVPANGETLWELDDLAPGRWTFGYHFVSGTRAAKRHDSVSKADFKRIEDQDLTYLITGTLSKPEGTSCPPKNQLVAPETEPSGENGAGDTCYPNTNIRFEFAVSAQTAIDNCQQDGLPGFAVADTRRTTVAITIHGDHLFFNGFPESSEGGIVRLAQLWADTDLNVDGEISSAEHQHVLLADMGEWNDTYQKGGAPLARLETVGDLTLGQLKTQGHMDGEGECASIDGTTSD
jgi:hypothetical protein